MLRSLRHNMSRFVSLIIIVTLGAGFFVGVKVTPPSMTRTAANYFDDNNFMDLFIRCSYGLTADDVAALKRINEVEGAQGQKFADGLLLVNNSPCTDLDGSQITVRAYGVDLGKLQNYYYGADDSDYINRVTLLDGRFPTQSNQCLVDESSLSTPDQMKIGNVITIEPETGEDEDSPFAQTQFEIVGVIRTPLYISFERGYTTAGNGKLGCFVFVPNEALTSEYYSEAYVTLKNSASYDPFSTEYDEYVSSVMSDLQTVADTRCEVRRAELATTIPTVIDEATKLYNSVKTASDEQLSAAEAEIEQYRVYAEDPEGAYQQAVNQFAQAYGIAESAFNGSTQQYQAAVAQYDALLQNYQNANTAKQQADSDLSAANNAVNQINGYITQVDTSLATARDNVKHYKQLVDQSQTVIDSLTAYQNGQMSSDELSQVLSTLQALNPELYDAVRAKTGQSLAFEAIALVSPYLEQQKQQLAASEESITEYETKLAEYRTRLTEAQSLYNQRQTELNTKQAELDTAYKSLNDMYNQLEGTKSSLSTAQIQLLLQQNNMDDDLAEIKQKIDAAPTYYRQALEQYNSAKFSIDARLKQIQKQIDTAANLLTDASSVSWEFSFRSDTPGFSTYSGAVETIDTLSDIFPVIFFAVAALTCFTTMTRMVGEDRSQMGTLKAIGYSGRDIASKYLLYSVFAGLIGALAGIVSGALLFPWAITKAYSIMFAVPPVSYVFPAGTILKGLLISVGTIFVAAALSCIAELRVRPALLMRPKAPKPGKRVLLEYFGFIWRRLSFTARVTVRNVFRRKSKLIMSILGIAGSTALICGSTGLYASIDSIMKYQYSSSSPISLYEEQVYFSEPQEYGSDLIRAIASASGVTGIMRTHIVSVPAASAAEGSKNEDVYLFVPEDASALPNFISLRNRRTGAKISLNDTGAVITEQFAEHQGLKPGDSVRLQLPDSAAITVPVAAVAENYAFNYVYMSENMYQYLTQTPVEYRYAVIDLNPGVYKSAASLGAFKNSVLALDGVRAVAPVSDTVDAIDHVVGVLSVIVVIFIISAGLLAFVVIYNLSNVNVSERRRELATIRVLGFRDKEMRSYVKGESIILTVLGVIIGLACGVGIHRLLINYCEVDIVMFGQDLKWYCFLIAAAATGLFSFLAGLAMNKKITSVDMVESLKSIE